MPQVDEIYRDTQRPDIPADERREANAELFKQFIVGLEIPDLDEVYGGVPMLAKASTLEPFYKPYTVGTRTTGHHTAILQLNEYGVVDNGQGFSRYLERPTSGFYFLRDVVNSTDLIQAVIRTRQRQINNFLRPEAEEGPLGFRFVRADGGDLTDADKKETAGLERFLMNGGDVDYPCERDRLRRPELENFVCMLLWDTLTADACPVELVRTKNGTLSGYHNLDFTSVRLTVESGYEGDDEIRAIQLHENIPSGAFTYEDILYDVRTPRTDIRSGGYGFAEVEGIVRACTGYLNAITYNSTGIDRSSVPRGVLNIWGEYDRPQLEMFKRHLRAMVSGASNRHTFPVLAANKNEGGVQWTPIDQFNEMFFARWVTFLVSIVCAQFGIDPTEISFDTFSTRSSALGGKADTEEKLSHSYDKGLIPTLRFVEKVLNKITVIRSKGKYLFRFVGIHAEDEDRKAERIKLSSTWNELRQIDGREPTADELIGKAPAGNPAMMQIYQLSLQQQGLIPQEGQQPGEEGADQGDDVDEDQQQAGDDDYPTDAMGEHSPYETDRYGGGKRIPDEEHFHTLDLGKAVPPRLRQPVRRPTVRRPNSFMAIIER